MPPPPSVVDLTEQHSVEQSSLAEKATALVAEIEYVDPEQWRDAVADVGEQLLSLQVRAAGLSDPYVTGVLQAQGAAPADGPAVNPAGFADMTDGGGSMLANLVFAGISVARAADSRGVGPAARIRAVGLVGSSVVLTAMQDTRRSSAQAAMWTRGAPWYVRMLNGTSCARCAVLAGRRYRVIGFARHPRCDCRMIPQAAETAGDWTTNPITYFRSLSTEDQYRIFTKAGAKAIRDGADISQVVNARQGITTVRSFGRDIAVTTVGTTRRAVFGSYEVLEDGTFRKRADSELRKLPGRRYRTVNVPRLLPDEIYRLAEEFGWDRAEVVRQLRRFAYLI